MPYSLRIIAVILLVTGIGLPALSQSVPYFAKDVLTITSSNGQKHPFSIELATTPSQCEYGLMLRTHMAKDAGMLFLFKQEKIVYMWMKDTYIPLDMVFIRKDGVITSIEKNAGPQSLEPIGSIEPVIAVLELNGGISNDLGIKPGDRVLYKHLGSK